jgi:integrase
LLYGKAIEVCTALKLTRADVWEATKEIRAAGTKAHSRDRVCRVADSAWDVVWEHCRRVFPTAGLWPAEWNRWTVSDWRREKVGYDEETKTGLNLPCRYSLHCARDHWAVCASRAGTPVAIIQAQLGHGSPMLTLTKYGRFLPSTADREKWEIEATRYEQSGGAEPWDEVASLSPAR